MLSRPIISLALLLASSTLLADASHFKPTAPHEQPKISINNRVLTKVQGKAITVIDLTKRMDLIFHRDYSHLESSVHARFQFYIYNWRTMLNEMIDSELILADAEEKKIPMSDGDIREELEQTFGPNVVETIDRLGLSYDEAWKMVKSELIVRRMTSYMVTSKAAASLSPADVRKAYEQYLAKHGEKEEWFYRVISIRNSDANKGAEAAQLLREELDSKEKSINIENLPQVFEQYKQLGTIDSETTLQVSEPYHRVNDAIATAHKEVLQRLTQRSFSTPIAQVSRADNATVQRIFFLEDHQVQKPTPFESFQRESNQNLFHEAISKEQLLYISKLRQHFGVDQSYIQQMVPEDFEPFSLN
jgi:hypothetical protein